MSCSTGVWGGGYESPLEAGTLADWAPLSWRERERGRGEREGKIGSDTYHSVEITYHSVEITHD